MNKKHNSAYTQIAIHLPKELAISFKQLALEVELGQSEAGEAAIKAWCNATIEKINKRGEG